MVIISDIHLGTYGCQAKELLKYLKSIEPKRLILNGDIIDIWQFKKRYWPKSHMQIIQHLLDLIAKGTKVDYVTGNHDELLRKFVGFKLGSFRIVNKLLIETNNEKTWIFHGDVFDVTMKYSKWLCRLGAVGYDTLILLNSLVNYLSSKLGRGKISLSKKVKNSVKSAVKYINDFENTAAEIAVENNYQNVVCGHIHQPTDKYIDTQNGRVRYLNSGDWIENLSALEYHNNEWKLYEYFKDKALQNHIFEDAQDSSLNVDELFNRLMQEFNQTKEHEQTLEKV